MMSFVFLFPFPGGGVGGWSLVEILQKKAAVGLLPVRFQLIEGGSLLLPEFRVGHQDKLQFIGSACMIFGRRVIGRKATTPSGRGSSLH